MVLKYGYVIYRIYYVFCSAQIDWVRSLAVNYVTVRLWERKRLSLGVQSGFEIHCMPIAGPSMTARQ